MATGNNGNFGNIMAGKASAQTQTGGNTPPAGGGNASSVANSAKTSVKLDKFLDDLGTDKFDLDRHELDKESLLTDRTNKLLDKATKHANIDEAKNSFKIAGKIDTSELERLVKDKKYNEDEIERAKKSGLSTKSFDDRLAKTNSKLEKHVRKLENHMQDHVARWDQAVEAAENGKETLLTKLQRQYDKVEKTILNDKDLSDEARSAKIDKLREHHSYAVEQIHDAHTDLVRDVKADRTSILDEIAKDVKRETGLDMSLYAKAKGNSPQDLTKSGAELGTMEKLWTKNTGMGKGITALGTLAILHGGYKIINPEVNPETGKSEISGGNVAEAGAGMLALISQVMSNKGVQAAVRAV
jgi:hypothetical protein